MVLRQAETFAFEAFSATWRGVNFLSLYGRRLLSLNCIGPRDHYSTMNALTIFPLFVAVHSQRGCHWLPRGEECEEHLGI
jgi:hypothetical protein